VSAAATRRQPLALAVAQPDSVPGDIAGNAVRHAALVRRAAARVVVFPELSLTGYALDGEPIDPSDVRLAPLVEACADSGSTALAGAPVRGDAGVHIAVLAVEGGGAAVAYRKMWLGGDEQRAFVPGVAPAVLVVDRWRLGLAVCKDTAVVAHAAATVALGIDAYVASVCEHEDDHDVQPARARRVIADHGVWVAVASFAGPTGGGFAETAGRSAIWRPDGSPALVLDRDPGEVGRVLLRDMAVDAG
jgi:predicted amidohydrolase